MIDSIDDIPEDLVVLPNPAWLTQDLVGVVMGADWYIVNDVLCASSEQIFSLSSVTLSDRGVKLDESKINLVDHADKRIAYDPHCADNSHFYTK